MKTINLTRVVFILIISFLFINPQISKAQLYLGATAGLNMSKIIGNDTFGGINNKIGISGGGIAGLKFSNNLSVQTEVLYSQKGINQLFTVVDNYRFQQVGDEFTTTRVESKEFHNKLTLSYLEIPIFAKASISLRGGIHPYKRRIGRFDIDIFAGPYFGLLLGVNADMSTKLTTKFVANVPGGDSLMGSPTEEFIDSVTFGMGRNCIIGCDSVYAPTKSELLPMDIGILFGGGISLEMSTVSKFTLSVRYSMGLMTIDGTYFNNDTGAIEIKNKNFGLHVGYIYFIGR